MGMKVIGTASPNSPETIRGRQRRCASIFNGSSVANMRSKTMGFCDGRPSTASTDGLPPNGPSKRHWKILSKKIRSSRGFSPPWRSPRWKISRAHLPEAFIRRAIPKLVQCRLERRHQSYGFRETPPGRFVPYATRDQWRQAGERAGSYPNSPTGLPQSVNRQNECLGHESLVGKECGFK